MKRILFTLLLALVGMTSNAQSLLVGDADQNGELTIADVTKTVNMVLGKETQKTLDVNDLFAALKEGGYGLRFTMSDGSVVNIRGIQLVSAEVLTPSAHEYVDLGLPSGTLWATCNIGADAPEDYGDNFAWGETEPKSNYNWGTYKWGESPLSKYNDSDGLQCLEPEDDAASVLWGSEWHMPTQEQSAELYDECDWTWTVVNGVSGRKVTSRVNGNYIFLPAAGCYEDSSLLRGGHTGYFWTNTIRTNNYEWAWDRRFTSDIVGVSTDGARYFGCSVRPVRASQ